MNHCTNCGAPLETNAKFCTKCGTSVVNTPNVKKVEIPKTQNNQIPTQTPMPTQTPVQMPTFNPNTTPTANNAMSKKNKIVAISVVAGIVVIVAGTVLFQSVIKPNMDRSSDYKQAIACAGSGDYEQAADIFAYLGDYKDSEQKWAESKMEQAKGLIKAEGDYDSNFSKATSILTEVGEKQDILSEDGKRKLTNLKQQCQNYDQVVEHMNNSEYSEAKEILQQMDSCPAVDEKLETCKNRDYLNSSISAIEEDDYEDDYYDDYDDDYDDEEDDGDYILANSSDEYLDKSDVKNLTSRELSLARNEIYARHGRLFESEKLQEYFDDMDWYDGRYTEVTEDELSQIERDNIKLIQKYEAKKGGAYSWK